MSEKRVIGKNNALPWHLPADFAWFKEKTKGKVLILGLNTFKSIGEKPLPNRKHVILSKDSNYKVSENCYLADSVDNSMEIAKKLAQDQGQDEIMVCGGASVYAQFLPIADRLYLTYINHTFEGDAYFPEFDINDWKEISRQDHQPDNPSTSSGQVKNKYAYSFVVLERLK